MTDGPWLVAGLGNPGEEYARTRHNAGAMVVERVCERLGVRLRKVRFLPVEAAEARWAGVRVLLVRPTTFMNVSGPPVAGFARKRAVPVDRVVACHDDLDLTFGTLRVRRGGSTAGHHGLESLAGALASSDFYRLRIGIGRPPTREQNIDWVLEPFPRRRQEDVELLLEEAGEAVLSLVAEGLARTQDRFNRTVVTE